jgi:hypothetical protein
VFRELVNCLARWNPDLAKHMDKASRNPQGYPSYMSASSQNQLIHSCAETLRSGILAEMKKAKYFSICLDTTPDHSKQDQLSLIIRYVNEEGDVVEPLLDIEHASKADASSLFTNLTDLLKKHDIPIENIRGQGYDGCSSMSGKYTGLQAKVKDNCPHAYFVHCFCHRMNLVVVDTCSKNVTTRNFFGVVEKLYAFIEGSTKRHGLFKDVQKRMTEEVLEDESDTSDKGHCKGTVKSLSTTRWSTRFDNLNVLQTTLPAVVKTLNEMISGDSLDRDSAGDALCLRNAINFEFCICLATLIPILRQVNVCSKYLQSRNMNIGAACSLVKSLTASLDSLRSSEQFDEYWQIAVDLGETIEVEYSEPRARKVSRRIDSFFANETLLTGKHKYCVQFFFETLDLMLTVLKTRFSSDVLPLLKSIKCLSSPTIENTAALTTLASFYAGDVNVDRIMDEYILFLKSVEIQKLPTGNIHELYVTMIKMEMVNMYPNLSLLYRLILTLPSTSVSCERSFSALCFVKNKLRTTMSQERLSDLMVIAVEGERSKSIDLNSVIDFFWKNFDVEHR